jgi:AcrR family transcriptional regulator
MARKSRPRTYHHGDLREALVAAGTTLIEKGGLGAFTLRECARRAGVSHAAPRNHFETIDDLIAEIVARGFEAFHAALEKAAGEVGPDPGDRLVAMGRAYVAFALARPGVYGLMFRTGTPLKRTEHLETAARAAWMQLVTEVEAVVSPDQSNIAAKAAFVWSLVHGIASLAMDKRLPPDLPLDDILAAAINGLPMQLRSSRPAEHTDEKGA